MSLERASYTLSLHLSLLPLPHCNHSFFLCPIAITPSSFQNYYFNLPARVLDAQVDHPHVTPVYTPPTGPKYHLYRRNDSTKMTPTEYVLHHDTVFLVLDENQVPPIINAVTQVANSFPPPSLKLMSSLFCIYTPKTLV